MTDVPAGARKPTDHKPKKQKKKPAAQSAPTKTTRTAGLSEEEAIAVASTMIAPTLLAPDPRFEVVDDGDSLLYHSKRSGDLTFPLDIPLGALGDVIDLDGNVEDPRQVVKLLTALAGEDVLKIGTRELMPVFERWTAELGAAMGGSVGESSSSPA